MQKLQSIHFCVWMKQLFVKLQDLETSKIFSCKMKQKVICSAAVSSIPFYFKIKTACGRSIWDGLQHHHHSGMPVHIEKWDFWCGQIIVEGSRLVLHAGKWTICRCAQKRLLTSSITICCLTNEEQEVRTVFACFLYQTFYSILPLWDEVGRTVTPFVELFYPWPDLYIRNYAVNCCGVSVVITIYTKIGSRAS